jgi:hypothetical protein
MMAALKTQFLCCAASFVSSLYEKYESLLRICAPCHFYRFGEAFFFAIKKEFDQVEG